MIYHTRPDTARGHFPLSYLMGWLVPGKVAMGVMMIGVASIFARLIVKAWN